MKFSNCLINSGKVYKSREIMIEGCRKEKSFNAKMYEFLIESTKEYNDAKTRLYSTISESTSYRAVNEGFDKFFSVVTSLIDKFIKFINKLAAEFLARLTKHNDAKLKIKANKSNLSKFNDGNVFTYEGFLYTFNDDIPSIEPFAQYNAGFVDLGKDTLETVLDSDADGDKQDAVARAIADKRAKLVSELNDGYYDKLRGLVLGLVGTEIREADWADALRAEYRNGDLFSIKFDVDKNTIMEALISFENYDKQVSSVKRLKDKIENDYTDIKRNLEKMITKNKSGEKMEYKIDDKYDGLKGSIYINEKVLSQIELLIKVKTEQLDKMSKIHGSAFSAKLDALLECYNQNIKVLDKAIDQVNKIVKEDIADGE